MNFTTRTIFSPILPLIEDEFGTTHARASSIFIFISSGYSFSLLCAGIYARFLGYKKSILICLTLIAAVYFTIPFIRVFEMLYLFAFLLGVATGMYLPAMLPLLTRYYDEKIWGRVLAIQESGAPFSIFCAPIIAVFLLLFLSWRGIFVVLGSAALLCVPLFYAVAEETEVRPVKTFFLGGLLRRREFWIITTIWVFAGAANLAIYYIIPLYLTKELLLDVQYANTVFGISRLGGVFVSISAGFLVERFSLKKTAFWLVLLTGIFTMLLVIRDLWWMKIMLFLQASISCGFFPVTLVTVSKMFPQEERGQAMGLIVFLAAILGIGVIPYLLGLSGDLLSFRFGILALGILTSLSAGLVFMLRKKLR